MESFNEWMGVINAFLWHDYVLYILLGTGVLFTVWSGFCQYRALTHGVAVIRGKYDKKSDPGAINHFQALSAALSATVGLGNIGGVALAVGLGGPGAVFWMWVVGFIGMALKLTEVTQSMLYRNTKDPENPHGGPMWVVQHGLKKMSPSLAWVGGLVGWIFCVTLLISAITGGNMFQAWNVGVLLKSYYQVPEIVTGIILAVLVGAVIIGGIKRIGAVAGRLVPFMCITYLLAAAYVLIVNIEQIPGLFVLIFENAFSPSKGAGAFLGGTMAIGMMWGMKRALFSSESGQGSAPIAHSAAKTDEPVREGVVAGLEPFIDTLVVCTLTPLVILSSGAWNRATEGNYDQSPEVVQTSDGAWTLNTDELPARTDEGKRVSGDWKKDQTVFVVFKTENEDMNARLDGVITEGDNGLNIKWGTVASDIKPELVEAGIYADYPSANLTSYAFDRVLPGLGRYIVPLVAFLFAVSTMISWSYYGEQGIIYMFGGRGVFAYKVAYCLLVVVACSGLFTTDAELDNLTGIGTGVMLFANIPIMLIFGNEAMKAYHAYIGKLKAGKFKVHGPDSVVEMVEGKHDNQG